MDPAGKVIYDLYITRAAQIGLDPAPSCSARG